MLMSVVRACERFEVIRIATLAYFAGMVKRLVRRRPNE
jgi:hypothetical protein